MLSAQARLRRSSDIATVLRRGTRQTGEFVVLHLLVQADESTKVAFAVGKNVGNSVTRHLVTRRLRHLVAQQLGQFPVGSHVVVRALPASATASYDQLRTGLATALAKAVRS
jgi:ribonuclease P protein component